MSNPRLWRWRIKFIDFFAGIGGMRSGLEKAGHTCVGFCEWDKYARQSYKAIYNTEGEWENHDVRGVTVGDIPRADLWSFGFPCQDISVAGKQKGLQGGERSGLFYQIVRLLAGLKEEDKPEWLVAENVKNLLSIGNGFDFARVILELGGVGYDVEWQLFNTKYSYVANGEYVQSIPQNRERIYIVGHLRSRGSRKILPIARADEENHIELKQVGCEQSHRVNPSRGRVYGTDGVSPTLNCCEGGGLQPHIIDNSIKVVGGYIAPNGKPTQSRRVFGTDGVAPTLDCCGGGGLQPHILDDQGRLNKVCTPKTECPTLRSETHGNLPKVIDDLYAGREPRVTDDCPTLRRDREGLKVAIPCPTPDREEKRQNGRRFKKDGEEMFTLTAQDRHGVAIYDGFNHKLREDENVGTLTANGNTSSTHCGTMLVVENEVRKN